MGSRAIPRSLRDAQDPDRTRLPSALSRSNGPIAEAGIDQAI